jgi:hypothetical protein
MASTPERGGQAWCALMANRVLELEKERGETFTLGTLAKRIERALGHLTDPDRTYDRAQVRKVTITQERLFPDADEVQAWCEVTKAVGEERIKAFWLVGLTPPELTLKQLVAASKGAGRTAPHVTGAPPARASSRGLAATKRAAAQRGRTTTG